MKRLSIILTALIMISCLLSVFSIAYADDTVLFCSECGRQIPVNSKFCMFCGHKVVFVNSSPVPTSAPVPTSVPVFIPTPVPAPSGSWGAWSAWSTVPVYGSSTRQVETRTAVRGYIMVHYGTQTDSSPHYRMFRNYSIIGAFDYFGARDTYGEKHFTRYVPLSDFYPIKTFEPGSFVSDVMENYTGFQKGNTTAYYFGDDKYVWFIESIDQYTEYRYRDMI